MSKLPEMPRFEINGRDARVSDSKTTVSQFHNCPSSTFCQMLTQASDEILDIFGQNPRLSRLYTQLCFCFRLPETPERTNRQAEVVDVLQHGLERLAAAFPWAAGKVVNTRGVYETVPHRKTPELQVIDAAKELPTFQEYRAAHFPFRFLDETVVASKSTLPGQYDEDAPVILFKANFIAGGLLLVIDAQHNCMDIRGQGEVIRLFAKACRGDAFSDEELQRKHFGRLEMLPRVITAPRPVAASSIDVNTASSMWSHFLFSSEAAKDLKTKAILDLPGGFVSTDDTLTAFVWQSVSRARMYRFPEGEVTTLERQIDARTYLSISSSFIGNVVTKTMHSHDCRELIEKPLGLVALELRNALDRDALAKKTLASATALVESLKGSESSLSSRSGLPCTDLKLSSWSKEPCCDLDFGNLLGKADAVRRPAFKAWEGLVYVLPEDAHGSIAVAICLRDQDLQRLCNDRLFTEYCTYVG